MFINENDQAYVTIFIEYKKNIFFYVLDIIFDGIISSLSIDGISTHYLIQSKYNSYRIVSKKKEKIKVLAEFKLEEALEEILETNKTLVHDKYRMTLYKKSFVAL